MYNTALPGQWLEADGRIKRWRSQREGLIHGLETGLIKLTTTRSASKSLKHRTRKSFAQLSKPNISSTKKTNPYLYKEVKLICEQMLDYLSAGHFEMYSQLLEEGSKVNARAKNLIKAIYKRIEKSTDYALNFNDKYDADEDSVNTEPGLPADFTRLSLELNQRFALEDQLIELLHESQRPNYL